MKLLISFLVFFVISGASATISISNEYYTNGATVSEGLRYDNMNFDNSVFIGRDTVISSGIAKPAGEGPRSYLDSTNVRMNDGGIIGGYVSAKGDLGSVSRGVVGGGFSSVRVNYGLGSGDLELGSYNADTKAKVRTHMESTHSFGSVASSPENIRINGAGTGSSSGNTKSISFEQDTWLSHMGKVAETKSGIEMIRKEGLKPVTYGWTTGAYSDGSGMADSVNQISVTAGDCDVDAIILGTSSALTNKETRIHLNPLDVTDTKDSNTGNPWSDPDLENMIDLLKRSLVEKKLFMSYEINP